jgi:hypothetical protein
VKDDEIVGMDLISRVVDAIAEGSQVTVWVDGMDERIRVSEVQLRNGSVSLFSDNGRENVVRVARVARALIRPAADPAEQQDRPAGQEMPPGFEIKEYGQP